MMDDARGSVHLNPRMVFRSLLAIVAVLGVLGVLAVAAMYTDVFSGPFPGDQILQQQFFLDKENNIPTWFSSALLLAAAGLAFFLGRFEPDVARSHRLRWYGLGVVLAIMSLDEMASLHETFTSMIRNALGLGGMLYFAWVVPGMLFVAAFGLSYLRFLFTLPRQVRVLLIAAGVVYLSGAVGMELVGGVYADGGNQDTLGYGLVTTVEELLEMVGLSLLTYTLLVHIEGSGPISIVIEQRTALPAG
jgi:hypothetical protein